ncbi:uncharacterized protein [Elaeis guineensis]|uniref:uncharacterized protein n=1 Tax=Elaeis guineensis var. tenera TaxID=51953 RepID=UPI003C6D9627
MKMVMLLVDWEVRKTRPVMKILSDFYTSLLSIIHDVTILYEGLISFARLNVQLEDKAQTAHAWAEVVEKLLCIAEEQEKKSWEKIALLEIELTFLESQQKKDKKEFKKLRADYQKEMESVKSALTKERGRRQEVEKAAKELKENLSATETRAQEASSRALAKFRESKVYEDKLSEASTDAYQLGFEDCKKAILRLQPKLDLSEVQADRLPEEEESRSGKKAEAEEDHPPPS